MNKCALCFVVDNIHYAIIIIEEFILMACCVMRAEFN